jgi:hypothetical protein
LARSSSKCLIPRVMLVHGSNANYANAVLYMFVSSYGFYLSAVLGFFVPYFDLDVILFPTPPCEMLVIHL